MSFVLARDLIHIREVWDDNLENEIILIREIVDDYPFINMGCFFNPSGDFRISSCYDYHTLRANVNHLKLIQLGLTFSDANGILPTSETGKACLWQFNFLEFNPDEDNDHAPISINPLKKSGIEFKKSNKKLAIEAKKFSELLFSSGVVLNGDVSWVTFHSPYDFAYMVKLLTWKSLPKTQAEFLDLVRLYFPTIYDVKYLMKSCLGSNCEGLEQLAEHLEVKVERVGTSHQAGSDSLLTCFSFKKLKLLFCEVSPVDLADKFHCLD